MSSLFTLRNGLIASVVALAIALGFEAEWGSALTALSASPRSMAGKPDHAAVLPDFRLNSEATNYAQITERPLLNPTRKPAPTQLVVAGPEPTKPLIRRGLYQLMGVTDLGETKFGQVREIATGRVQSVKQGQSLQEMIVKSVDVGSVTLVFADESEVLELPKYTASGRIPQTVASVAAAATSGPPPQPPPVMPIAAPPIAAQSAAVRPSEGRPEVVADVSSQMAATLARRRLAREQQAQQLQPPPSPGAPSTSARPSQ